MKILFQEPFAEHSVIYGKFHSGAGNNTFPYGIASIATYVKKMGHDVAYLDPQIDSLSIGNYLEYIKSNSFELIGLGATTIQIDAAIDTFRIIKEHAPHIITVLGGVHGTLMPLETMGASSYLDYIVLGEGEKPFSELVTNLTSGRKDDIRKIRGLCFKDGAEIVINQPDQKKYLTSAELPIPLFDIFPMKKYVAQITYAKVFPSYSIIASRGCPYRCTFCNASDTLGKKLRYKPVDVLLEEIRILKNNYGAKGLMFLDSTFTVNKKWVAEFCEKYQKAGFGLPWACNTRADTVDRPLLVQMKNAGCWSILYGIESGNQKSLDIINKGTTVDQNTMAVKLSLELDYYVYTSYIICMPNESEEDVLNTIKYARRLGSHMAMFYLPVPYPQTRLYETCRELGGLNLDAKWKDFNAWDFSNPVYVNPKIGKERMQELYKKAFVTYYSNPVVLYRNLRELAFLRQSPYKFWLGLKGFISGIF